MWYGREEWARRATNIILPSKKIDNNKHMVYTTKQTDLNTYGLVLMKKRNQIDYIMISTRFRNSVKQTKTYPDADIGSDHNPVVATVKINLKKDKEESEHGTVQSGHAQR